MRLALGVALLAAVTLASGCNRYSRVVTSDEQVVRVDLQRGDATAVYGETPGGEVVRIERSEIIDVTRPGNVALGVFIPSASLMFGGMVGTLFAMERYDTSGDDEDGLIALAAVMGVGALGLSVPVIWYTMHRATARAVLEGGGGVGPAPAGDAGVWVAPTVVRARDGSLGGGLGLDVRF